MSTSVFSDPLSTPDFADRARLAGAASAVASAAAQTFSTPPEDSGASQGSGSTDHRGSPFSDESPFVESVREPQAAVCTVTGDVAEGVIGFSVTAQRIRRGKLDPESFQATLFIPEVAMAPMIPSGTKILGHLTALAATPLTRTDSGEGGGK